MHPTFRWLERGEGEPIVLLHGLMGRMDHWDSALQALAPDRPADRAGRSHLG